jgi:hypothetical protein
MFIVTSSRDGNRIFFIEPCHAPFVSPIPDQEVERGQIPNGEWECEWSESEGEESDLHSCSVTIDLSGWHYFYPNCSFSR